MDTGKTSKSTVFAVLLGLFLLVKVLLSFFLPQNFTLATDLTSDNILKAVNNQRQIRNLTALNTNNLLSLAAQSKSQDMITRKYFAHIDPDGHYIWDKIVALGYTPYLQLGENLAIDFYDTDSLVSAWMNSPTHRANLLNDGFKDQGMGLGFGDTAQGQYYSAITNTFGTLAPVQQPKKVAAPSPAPSKPAAKSQPTKNTTAPKPKPKTLGTESTSPTTTLIQAAPPSTSTESGEASLTPVESPIMPRQNTELADTQPKNFALPSNASQTSASASSPSTSGLQATASPAAVVGSVASPVLNNYETNRKLLLACGIILLLLMLWDIKKSISQNVGSLDKKTNNLVLLILSLAAIAFIYWM